MTSRWSSERVDATVTPGYIARKLGPKKQSALYEPLAFGQGLTDDTYLDWIVSRSRKLFLVLDDIGCSEHIFEAVDKSFDDDDLPLTEAAIADLDLSKSSGKKFAQRQYAYLVHDLYAGAHIDFGDDDVIPVDIKPRKKGIQSSVNVDRVQVGDKIYLRRRLSLDEDNGIEKIHFILHFKSLQRLKHPHLTSVWATYTHKEFGYVLLHPSSELTLKSFMEEPPKHFKSLSKPQQREIVINWIQCLTNALSYLHENGHAHQAIRPSNVFVDNKYNIYLGAHGALGALEDKESGYEKEAYNHAAPEQWQKRATIAETNPLRSTLQSGGRTGRRIKPGPSSSGSSSSSVIAPTIHRASGERATESITECYTMDQTPGHRTSSISTKSPVPTDLSNSRKGSADAGRQAPRGRALVSTLTFSQPNPSHTLFDASPYYPSDVFSMCTIVTYLLSMLTSISNSGSKYSPSNISTHLGKKNRSAGRGGAPADCSWHSNLGQVSTWLDLLETSAKERSKGLLGLGRKDKEIKDGESESWRWQGFLGSLTYLIRKGLQCDAQVRWTAVEGVSDITKALKLWGITPASCCIDVITPPSSIAHSIPETPIFEESLDFSSLGDEMHAPPQQQPMDYKHAITASSAYGVGSTEIGSTYELDAADTAYPQNLNDAASTINISLDEWPATPGTQQRLPFRGGPLRPMVKHPSVPSTPRRSVRGSTRGAVELPARDGSRSRMAPQRFRRSIAELE